MPRILLSGARRQGCLPANRLRRTACHQGQVGGYHRRRVPTPLSILQGRGTPLDPPNRFEPLDLEPDGDTLEHDRAEGGLTPPRPATRYLHDRSRSIVVHNDSPDVGFEFSVNPYRGCEHGCIYCYARPGHEYLGWSAGLDFESRIMVKLDAPRLLARELAKPGWQPTPIAFAGVTDVYQPVERRLGITRQCLKVCRDFRNPLSVITKSALIQRDIDLLAEMARRQLCIAFLSVTTLDNDLSARMEPRASAPRARLEAVRALASAGIPTGVMVAPVVPGLTDHEIPRILRAAADAGASFAGYIVLRLPYAVKALFSDWLARHFPDRREKVLNRVRELRRGKLNDPEFRTRMRGQGPWAEQFKVMFDLSRRRAGLDRPPPQLSTEHFRQIDPIQPMLWDS